MDEYVFGLIELNVLEEIWWMHLVKQQSKQGISVDS